MKHARSADLDGRPLVLRRAARSDLERVADLERKSFAHPWSRDAFAAELRNPRSLLLLAWCDEDLVGYLCRWIVEDEMQILNVVIDPRWRRRGLGRWLIEQALAEANEHGLLRLTLEVRRHNVPAVALYRRMGFRRVGERRNYYGPGEDALLMEREVDRAVR